MNKDKESLTYALRLFKKGHSNIDSTADYILKLYKDSKRFNSNSFMYGFIFGCIISILIAYLKLK